MKNIYRGLPIAIIAFLSTGLPIGMAQYSFGEFSFPLINEFGWSQTELNFGLSMAFISSIIAPFLGRISDKIGIKPVMIVSMIMIALGFVLRPLISELWHWYFLSALVFAGFPGTTVLPSGKLVAAWYPSNRGRVMGAVTAGNNFGGVCIPPIAAFFITYYSWELAYIFFCMIIGLLCIMTFFIVSDDPNLIKKQMKKAGKDLKYISKIVENKPSGKTLKEALLKKNFYLMTFALTGACFTYQGVLTQLRQHFEESGFSPATATAGLTTVAFMGIGSKLFFGRISEKITAKKATIIAIFFQTIGVIIFSLSNNNIILWIGIFIFSLGFGGLGALIVLLVQELYGMVEFSSIMGIILLANIIPGTFSSLLAGAIHDRTNSFDLAFMIIGIIFITSMISLLSINQKERY